MHIRNIPNTLDNQYGIKDGFQTKIIFLFSLCSVKMVMFVGWDRM